MRIASASTPAGGLFLSGPDTLAICPPLTKPALGARRVFSYGLLRWRADLDPDDCRLDQVPPSLAIASRHQSCLDVAARLRLATW